MRARSFFALPLALAALPALAQDHPTATTDLQLIGTAPAACLLGTPRADNPVNMTFAVNGTSSGRIGIVQLVSPSTAQTLPASIQLSLPVTCNSSHRVQVHSTNSGLLRVGAASPNARMNGFGQFSPYSYQIQWTGRTVDRSSTAGDLNLVTQSPGKGDLMLRLSTPAGEGPLVAGEYNDVIVIEVLALN